MKRVIIVATTDEIKPVSELTLPKLRAYAKKCSAELIVLEGMPEKYQHPKYRMFEASKIKADRYLIIDVDIITRTNAPDIFEALPSGNWMMDEGAMRGLEQFERHKHEVVEYAGRGAQFGASWWNPGVSLLNRDAVKAIYQMPPWDVRENLFTVADGTRIVKNMPWINYQIAKHNIKINPLPVTWNCFVNATNKLSEAHFWHCAGNEICKNGVDVKQSIIKSVCDKYEPRKCSDAHVHFVIGNDQHRWILGKFVRQMQSYAPNNINVTKGEYVVEGSNAVNVFIPYRAWHLNTGKAKSLVFFTHPGDTGQWNAAMQCDAAIVMCNQYRQALIAAGMEEGRVTRIHFGIDEQYRDCRLRIFHPGRMVISDEYQGRKGWEDWKRLMECDWLHCIRSEGLLTDEQMHDEYMKADVIVSTATMEGGPMACIEALAMSKLYLGRAGVGLHDEYVRHIERYHDSDELVINLFTKYKEKESRKNAVGLNQWPLCAQQIWDVIGKVMGRELICGERKAVAAVVDLSKAKPARRRMFSIRANHQ